MNYDLKILDEYVDRGLLRKAVSKDGKLAQYNYTDQCIFADSWDDITLNNRGNVYEVLTGQIIARSMPKFFNWSQIPDFKQKKYLEFLDDGRYHTYEKIDGTLSILYCYDGEWRLNSRGSFNSFASEAGKRLLSKYDISKLNPEVTYIFETVSPETKIIIDYHGLEELFLLTGYYTESGKELTDATLQVMARVCNFPRPLEYLWRSFDHLLETVKTLPHNEEGFVIKLFNGCRFKLKGLEYLKVAKLLKNCTKKALWKTMKDGLIDIKDVMALPDEFQKEALKYRFELEEEYQRIKMEIVDDFEQLCDIALEKTPEEVKANPNLFAKEIAEALPDEFHDGINLIHYPAMFNELRSKNHNKYIMKLIEPESL
jgi:RNA ligase